jgi:hypothetical protein
MNPDGWIEWSPREKRNHHGMPPGLTPDHRVDVKLENGIVLRNHTAVDLYWDRPLIAGTTIVAYRSPKTNKGTPK